MFKYLPRIHSTDDSELAAAKARGDIIDPPADDKNAEDEAAAKKAAEEEAAKKAASGGGDGEPETEEEREARLAEEKAAAEKADREKNIRIPKWRFDQATAKAKQREEQLKARISELEAATGAKKGDDQYTELQKSVKELRDKYEDLLLEGKKDEARKVRNEMEAAQDRLTDYRAATTSDAARREAIDTLRYDQALANLEQQYPELNPDNDDSFDEDKVNEVSQLMAALIKSQGLTRHAALNRAARYVLGAPKAAGKQSDADASEAKKQREVEARRKAADAAKRQPADSAKTGKDSDKDGAKGGTIDVMKLTKTAFDKLTEEQKAKLRGDDLAA